MELSQTIRTRSRVAASTSPFNGGPIGSSEGEGRPRPRFRQLLLIVTVASLVGALAMSVRSAASAEAATSTVTSLDSNWLCVRGGKNVYCKDGELGAEWQRIHDNADDVVIAGDRLCIRGGKDVYCKDGALGARWNHIHDNADDVVVSGDRLCVRGGRKVYCKDGALGAKWQLIHDNANDVVVSGDRLCVRGGKKVYCKDGTLGAKWQLTHDNANDVVIAGDRLCIRGGKKIYCKDGTLGAGWNYIHHNSNAVSITPSRLCIRSSSVVHCKDGGLGSKWNRLHNNANDVELSYVVAPPATPLEVATEATMKTTTYYYFGVETSDESKSILSEASATYGTPVIADIGTLHSLGCLVAGIPFIDNLATSTIVIVYSDTCVARDIVQTHEHLSSPYADVQLEGLIGGTCLLGGESTIHAGALCWGFQVGVFIAETSTKDDEYLTECFLSCSNWDFIVATFSPLFDF